ncbi:MAG TPA: acyltransferase family protein [Candidatus Acidoferrales bacterium]|nr:acyltransferase family protein [Candidatus Acidoferrales bacterium]
MKRYPYLDWLRGLAILIMIQCHAFNSFTRVDLREGGAYVLSQFVGGMAAPLFLFMAGMTTAFQMDSLAQREPDTRRRWLTALRRGGYILGIAFLFRFTNWLFSVPRATVSEITKVDILNCMGVGLGVLAVTAVYSSAADRVRFAAAAGLLIAVASPVIANLDWSWAPPVLADYIAPSPRAGRFPFFPCASYLAFGIATGTIAKRAALDRIDRLMQWSVLVGFTLIFAGQYFANIPYSIYAKSSFWSDSPALILIRTGIALLLMAAAYLWTEYCAGGGWSWMQTLGKNSLMVYWVHVMIVYGAVVRPIKRQLSIPQAVLATGTVIAMMVVLSVVWLWWKGRRPGPRRVKAAA